jgi:hypothetical protein
MGSTSEAGTGEQPSDQVHWKVETHSDCEGAQARWTEVVPENTEETAEV